MSSIGYGLIKSLVEHDLPLTDLYEQGIDETFFVERERTAFEFLKNFRQKHGTYPKLTTIAAESGSITAFDSVPCEVLGYWIPQVRERKQFNLLTGALKQITDKADAQDTKGGIEVLKGVYEQILQTETTVTVKDLQDLQLEVIEDHNKRQVDPDLPGISYGFPSLDETTGGNQGGDFNLIVGETGVGKSYVSGRMTLSAYQNGASVLKVSPEMPEKQSARRILAMMTNLQDREIKRGLLSYYAIEKARQMATQPLTISGQRQDNFLKILPSGLSSDINSILTIAGEYSPDILVVDGIYLINNPRLKGQRWEIDESVYYELKNFALRKNIPILATTQYNKSDPRKLQGARGTQSASQIASTFLSLEYENDEDRETHSPQQNRLLKVKKSRDGDRIVIRVGLDFNRTKIYEDTVISGPEYLREQVEAEEQSDPDHVTSI
jgi:replicative DNA helicase